MLSFGFSTSPLPAPLARASKNALSPFQGKPSSLILGKRADHRILSLAKSGKLVDDGSASNIEVEYHQYEISEEANEESRTTATLLEGLKPELMPKHVSMIIDGDDQRRWAEERDFPVELGYVSCRRPVERIIRLCCELGIKVLSFHLFSTENLQLPQEEVDFAMNLVEAAMTTTLEDFMRDGIKVSVNGNKMALPKPVQEAITLVEETTKDNTTLHLLGSINNNGLSDITQACKTLAGKVKNGMVQPEDIDETLFRQQLQTNSFSDLPTADLLIRMSGMYQLTNFTLWQSAYSEIIFVEKYISDFKEADFIHILDGFQKRSKRFGGRN